MKQVLIQEALQELEKWGKDGVVEAGSIEYFKVLAMFAIAERLERIVEALYRGQEVQRTQ